MPLTEDFRFEGKIYTKKNIAIIYHLAAKAISSNSGII